ncbi:hypothetical protein BT93_B0170 [Corymbia citriodora subsp. variegata]|nr:hypothetical protein BT93_B0170 [Corymbia citriodora subsp. variegata]
MVDTETARMIVGFVDLFVDSHWCLRVRGNMIILVTMYGNHFWKTLFVITPTFITICKKKTAEGFKPDPYVVAVLNCAIWVFHGLIPVLRNSQLVVLVSAFGLLLELIYVGIFFVHSPWNRRRNILIALLVELIFMAALVAIALKLGLSSAFVEMLCMVFTIAMYISPLTIMHRVIQMKSVKYMPFYLSLAIFLNGIIWTVYALLKFDFFVLVANGLGALSGLVQLILYAKYYRTTKWDELEKPASKIGFSSA